MPEFTRTQAAAGADKNRDGRVAAIAQDAVDAGLPITSADSVIAAKAAVARWARDDGRHGQEPDVPVQI